MMYATRVVQRKRHRIHGKVRECSSLRTLCECSWQHSGTLERCQQPVPVNSSEMVLAMDAFSAGDEGTVT